MRNLKRALSLAMASVMLLGMMVVGAGAASFSDVDSSNDLEAIEVMNAVGVMQGDERGFRPNDPISRNEIAKVMALLLKLSPEDYTYAATPFTDVPEWAQPYVAAIYANKITDGTSPTTYSGENNVSAVQAARMMLRALGYLKNPEDDGDDWVLATVTQASKIGLYDGVDQSNAHAALTRNQVATMAVNALEATMVEDKSNKGFEVNTPEGVTVTQAYVADYREIGRKEDSKDNYCGGDITDGVGTQQLCEYLYGSDLKKVGGGADDFGRPGSIWRYKGKEVVGSPDAPIVTYDKKPSASTIKADLKGYSLKNINGVYVNGDDTVSYEISAPADIRADAPKLGGKLGNGTRLEIYANSDNEVTDIVVVTTYLAQANADYDAEDDELDITVVTGDISLNSATLSGDDFAIEDYKENDYLLITATGSDKDGYDVQSVEPATVVSGVTVSAWDDDDYVTAGGTKYEYNVVATKASAVVGGDLIKDGYTLQKTEYTLILDGNGYVLGVKATADEEQLTDYLFVKDVAKNGFDYQAKVVFMDGTSKTVTVSEVNGKAVTDVVDEADANKQGTIDATSDKLADNQFYTFTVNKSGEYELKTVVSTRQKLATVAASATGIDPDAANGKVISGSSEPANSKTVFVAKDKAYVGVKNAPKVTMSSEKGGSVFYLLDVDEKYVLAAYTATKGSSSTDASEYVYILSTDASKVGTGKDEDGNNYYIYNAIVDGKKGKLNANSNIKEKATGVYEISSYTDGYADLTFTDTNDQVNYADSLKIDTATDPKNPTKEIAHKGDVVTAGTESFVLADDATIISIDKTDGDATRTISAASLNNLKDGTYEVWAVETSGTDSDIAVLYVVRLAK